MSNYPRFKYNGATPGADSADYVLFSTTAAFGAKCACQMADLRRVVINLFHTQAGTFKLYRSSDRGLTWTQVKNTSAAAPSAGLSTQYEALIETFEDWKLVWTNGGSAQATFYVDGAIVEQRIPASSGAISIVGVTGFDTTNVIASAAGGGYRGNTAGFTIAILCRINSQVLSAQLYSYNDAGLGGYYFVQDTATTVRFLCGDGVTTISSPAYSPAADLGNVILLVGRHTGPSGAVSLWSADAKVGADAATTAYALPGVGLRCTVGTRNNLTAAHTGLDMFAWSGFDIALSDAQIHALYDSVRLTGKIPSNLTGTQSDTALCCNVIDSVSGPTTPSTYLDTAGAAQNFTVAFGSSSGLDLVTAQVTP